MRFFTKKTVFFPTGLSWVLLAAITLLLSFLAVRHLYGFLALNAPTKAQAMIIEGWLPDYALEQAVAKFRKERYNFIITTGSPLERGSYLKEYNTYADLAKATLVAIGIDERNIQAIASPKIRKDRTYFSAVRVARWLRQRPDITAVNIITLGPHSRRSYDLYQEAFPASIAIGIHTIPSDDYDSSQWWRSSAGIKNVLIEAIAYAYYTLLWSNPERSSDSTAHKPLLTAPSRVAG